MLNRVELDMCRYFGQQEFFSALADGHCRRMGSQFLPIFLSLPGFTIWMIIALCHILGICSVEIDRLKMLVR